MMIVLNGSGYTADIMDQRHAAMTRLSQIHGYPIIYTNLVGGQDELVFDGGSMVYDHSGGLSAEVPQFEEGLYPVDFLCEHHCQPI